MPYRICIIALALVLALAACSTAPPPKEGIGAATGAVLGGVLGATVGRGTGRDVAAIAGSVLGAFLGSSVGRSMDQVDQLKTAAALESNRTGAPTAWRNPDTGYAYTVTPTRTYDTPAGPCREFETVADLGGRREVVRGTACRQPDGTWRAM
jgi:surface antigen